MIQRLLLWVLVVAVLGALPVGFAQDSVSLRPPTPPEAPEPPGDPGSPDASVPEESPDPEQSPDRLEVDSGFRIQIGRGLETSSEFVQVGSRVHVRTNQTAPEVVVINSSALIDGEVESDVVVVGGKAVINGHVHGDVVGVGSGIVLGPGAVVDGDAVSVIGRVVLGPNARVGGDAVGLGGGVVKDDSASVDGDVVNGNWSGLVRLGAAGWPEWLTKSFTELVLNARLLSFQVRWVWAVALLFFLLHLLVILIAPRANRVVVATVSNRGATAFLMGLFALPLGCLVALFLVPTVVGILAIPFLMAAVFCLGIAGKSGVLQHLGATLAGRFQGDGVVGECITMVHEPAEPVARVHDRKSPAVAHLAVGTLLVGLLYLVPIVGFTVWMALTVWALGTGILALLEGFRSESKGATAPRSNPRSMPTPGSTPCAAATPSTLATSAPTASAMASTGTEALVSNPVAVPTEPAPEPAPSSSPSTGSTPSFVPSMVSEPAPEIPTPLSPAAPAIPETSRTPPETSAPAAVPEALSLPRVAVRERILATLIDWIGVGFLVSLTGWVLPPFVPMIAYFVGFWMWKQTTLGGIILRIRVVRLDGRKIDLPTALVRSIGAFFGVAAFGIGYFWAAWDDERQGWHDKLAGTVVVRVPKVQSLV